MEEIKPKTKKWQWIACLVVFLALSWLFANWQDFKEGVAGGYAETTKSKP